MPDATIKKIRDKKRKGEKVIRYGNRKRYSKDKERKINVTD